LLADGGIIGRRYGRRNRRKRLFEIFRTFRSKGPARQRRGALTERLRLVL